MTSQACRLRRIRIVRHGLCQAYAHIHFLVLAGAFLA